MKNVKKKLTSLFLAFAVMLTTVLCGVTSVQAKSSVSTTNSVYTDGGSASAGETRAIPFSVTENNGLEIYIIVPSPVEVNVVLCDSQQKALASPRTASVDLYDPIEWEGQTYYAIKDWYTNVPAGDYFYAFQFAQDTQVFIDVEQINTVSIQSKATITAGFAKKLSVSGAKVKSWASRDKSVATVDKNGKVTAKKKGKTKIIATLADGENKLECTVTVAANKYSATKYNVDDAKKGSSAIVPYEASFDSKGNIVIKAQVINNTSYRLGQIKNIKLVVEDENGKTVGTYKATTTKVNVLSQSTKNYSFVIKKADLKKKKVDLRNSLVTVKIKNADKAAVYYR